MTTTALRICNVVGYIFLILVNTAASRGWPGFRHSNAELSKRNDTPITPAGWAFSIWGLIFLLQGAGVVYQALELWYEDRASTTLLVEAIGYWWVLGWIAECAWQFFFQQQSRTALWICMLCLLGGLFSFANAVTNLYRLKAQHGPSSPLLYTIFYLPTSINTAWLSVASCIGILIVAKEQNLGHLELGAILLAGIATVAGLYATLVQRDIAYGLVLVWALVAVYAKQQRRPVGVAALVCAVANLVAAVVSILQRRSALVEGDYIQAYSEL